MKKTSLRLFTVLGSVLILSACQNPVVKQNNAFESSEVIPTSWVKLSAQSVVLNGSIELPNSQGTSSDTFTIQSLYTSALGKDCMQASENKTGLLRVLCQTSNDYWQTMPYFNQVTP